MTNGENSQNVIVTDIHMPFLSMVVFMVKWAIAAIPAFVILIILGFLTTGILGGLVRDKTVQITGASGRQLAEVSHDQMDARHSDSHAHATRLGPR
jgi:hypothetical protein